MRLLSITVRNYRVHRDLRVDLDPARTVIGGPNECGKSTLMEAAHRALFLKARITGEGQKSMVSREGLGHPEVEVEFAIGDRTYRIAKRFSGGSGTARLSETGGGTWQDDEAETRLAALLKVEPVTGGRGAAERSAGQWAHLWVRQGRSGDDPTAAATDQSKSLLASLQSEGGAAVMQSDLDSRLARQFAKARDAIFTTAGKPKAGSELLSAEARLEDAGEMLAAAREEVRSLHEAAGQLRGAETTIRELEKSLPALKAQQDDNTKARAKAAELTHRIGAERVAKDAKEEKRTELAAADKQIRTLTTTIAEREARMQPDRDREQELAAAEKAAADRLKEARQQADAAARDTQLARRREMLARAWLTAFERDEAHAQLDGRMKALRQLRRELEAHEDALAALPPVDAKTFKRLEMLAAAARESTVALEAMATGIEVTSASVPVTIGDDDLPAGEQRIIAEDTEVTVGDHATLRIVPGGGSSLADARERAKDAQAALDRALDEAGVPTLEEAAAKLTARTAIDKKAEKVRARIDAHEPAALDAQLGEARVAAQEAKAAVEQRRADDLAFDDPPDLEAAAAALAHCEEALRRADDHEHRHLNERTAAEKAWEQAAGTLRKHRASIEQATTEINGLAARLRVLLDTHGADKERAGALEQLTAESKTAAATLAASERELASLNPEQLDLDHQRLERAITKATAEKVQAGQQAAVARAALTRDGTTDPEAALALAEAAESSARDHCATVQRHADAITRLADLFSAEQRSLAGEFTRPLAEKVSGYLQCLFGRETRAAVTLTDRSFEGLQLTRPDGTYDFDDLSGGTREQVAAAFRLAMAEILAGDFGGHLPVVFDDAFTHSDPDRVQALQRMLDLAANRGLQVIVLTCHPADYSGLGAETVNINPQGVADHSPGLAQPGDSVAGINQPQRG